MDPVAEWWQQLFSKGQEKQQHSLQLFGRSETVFETVVFHLNVWPCQDSGAVEDVAEVIPDPSLKKTWITGDKCLIKQIDALT